MRSKLITTTLFSCLAVGFASAQALSASETDVNQAFITLRGIDKVLFRLQGNIYYGATTTPISSDLFWDRPAASTAQDMKLELLEAQNSIVTHRVVGDGQHLWSADLLKNTYSVARYGSYTATVPTDYFQNGLQSFNLLASGQSALLARMTREIWGGLAASYRPWIPASTNRSEATISGGATATDPVVPKRSYVSTPTTEFHVYWLTKAGIPTRSLTFELVQNPTTGGWDLGTIYFSDSSQIGATTRLVDWRTDVYTSILPSTGNFVFTPTPGARAIAGPRPNGSG